MQGRDPRCRRRSFAKIRGGEIRRDRRPGGEIRGASLRSSDGQNGMGPPGCVCAVCGLCAAGAAAWLPPPSARARAWVIVFLPQALIMNDPGPVRPIASGRTSRTQVADTDNTHISGTRHGSRVTRELERTISRRTKHHRTSLLRADPEQDRRRGASVTLSLYRAHSWPYHTARMAVSHNAPLHTGWTPQLSGSLPRAH